MDLILSSISQGLLWSILAMGVYLTYRILDVADLTVEGSFPLGAAVASAMIVAGIPAWIATVVAFLAGGLAGLITGFLHAKLKIPALLAGIVTMTGLYSINLRILGQANLTLLNSETLINQIQTLGVDKTTAVIIAGIIAIVIVIVLLHFFFNTELGLSVRATGDNLAMSEANGINVEFTKILGFMLGNGLISLSGALLAQNNGYADVNMGIGAIVIGLASVIIGETFFSNLTLARRLTTLVIGSIIYRLLILGALELQFNPQDLKLISAILLAIALALPSARSRWKYKRMKRQNSRNEVK
ncbi:MAG TPA: ABC transporter permease [Atopostipes sp.]|nr:ABC transporter permease [Atopostipes sp.]